MVAESDAAAVAGAEWVVDVDDIAPAGETVGSSAADPPGRVCPPGDAPAVLVARRGADVPGYRLESSERLVLLGEDDRPLGVVPDVARDTDTTGHADAMDTEWVGVTPRSIAPGAWRVALDTYFSARPVGLARDDTLLGFAWPGRWAVAWTTADPLTGTVGADSSWHGDGGPETAPGAAFLGRVCVGGASETRERAVRTVRTESRPVGEAQTPPLPGGGGGAD